MKRPWTAEDVAKVRSLYEAGQRDEDIGAAIGRSAASVSNLRQSKGITRPEATLLRAKPWSVSELGKARELYAIGTPNAQIAEFLGRSAIAVKRLVTTYGLRRDPFFQPNPSAFDTDSEKWRKVPSVPTYAVSTAGRVRSLIPGKVGKLLRPWVDEDGYLHVQLSVGGSSKRHSIHRLVALAFLETPDNSALQVAHGDGNPSNNNLSNLRWASGAENQADRLIHGTAPRDRDGKFRKARKP